MRLRGRERVSTQVRTWLPPGAELAPSVPNLVSWLDASDGATLTLSGNSVTAWADKSGNGNNATQTDASKQPTYNVATLNGLPVIEFDGTTDKMRWFQPASATFTLFFVARSRIDNFTNKRFISNYDGAGALTPGEYVLGWNNSNQVQLLRESLTLNATATRNTNAHLFAIQNTSVSAFIRYDGTQTNSGTGYGTAPVRELYIGEDQANDLNENWDGVFAELLFYDRALSPSEVLIVEAFLRNKWGTP